MGGFYRKSEAGLTILLILIVLVLFFGWLINLSQRECKSNRDCGSESYCGSDFSCHPYPTIQKTEYNLVAPALIIGIAIVIAAWIFRKPKEEPKQNVEQNSEAKPEVEEIAEPYYKSNNNIKTP